MMRRRQLRQFFDFLSNDISMILHFADDPLVRLSAAMTGAAMAAATTIAARMPSAFLFKRSLLRHRRHLEGGAHSEVCSSVVSVSSEIKTNSLEKSTQ
jgi:hypothetical protein